MRLPADKPCSANELTTCVESISRGNEQPLRIEGNIDCYSTRCAQLSLYICELPSVMFLTVKSLRLSLPCLKFGDYGLPDAVDLLID